MLLDKYVLTKHLSTLLTLSPHPSTTTTLTAFTKRVTSAMTRLDPLLKTLQVRPSPPEGLVQAYLIHIADRSDTNFRKILELKGVRKQDQPGLVEMFGIHREAQKQTLVAMSPLLTPLMNTGGLGSALGGSGGGGAGGLGLTGLGGGGIAAGPVRFDPAGFGEKLFSAARDGVDRMGTGSPLQEEAKASVEGNLKSIGKFFRRDMSGFGRFGGRREDDR